MAANEAFPPRDVPTANEATPSPEDMMPRLAADSTSHNPEGSGETPQLPSADLPEPGQDIPMPQEPARMDVTYRATADDRHAQISPEDLATEIVRTLSPQVAQDSALIGSGAVYMTLGGESRLPRDNDIMTTESAYRYLREQPGWEESQLPTGGMLLRNGKQEVGMNDGTWPALPAIRERGWTTTEGLVIAGLPDIYAWKQERGTEKDASDTQHIRERLQDPTLPPLPASVMPSEIEIVRSALPEHLQHDPNAQVAIRLAASGLYTVSTLYGDGRIGRANQIIGSLEKPEYGTVATYHNGFHLADDVKALQRHFDNVPGVTDEQRLDATIAETHSDAIYGNGRKSHAMPGGHDELRSAELARAHALAVGHPEQRANEIHDATLDTEFDEATGSQRGVRSTSVVGRAVTGVDLQSTVDPESGVIAYDLAVENDTSERWSPRRTLGKVLQEFGIHVTGTEQALEFIDEYPNACPSDAPTGPTIMESLTNQIIGSADFRDPAVDFGYKPAEGWTLDNPQARIEHATELRRIGHAMKDGTMNATQGYRAVKEHEERMRRRYRQS